MRDDGHRFSNRAFQGSIAMTHERWKQLMEDQSLSLTPGEADEGWHFCHDWDGLLIHDTDPEAEACTCG